MADKILNQGIPRSSGLCRGSRPGSKDSRASLNIFICCILIIVAFIVFMVLSPWESAKPTTLSASQITSLRNLYQKVVTLEKTICDLERELDSTETRETLSSPIIVAKYYQRLTELYVMRDARSVYAQNYNGLVRAHFAKTQTSPTELATAKGGFLPVSIR